MSNVTSSTASSTVPVMPSYRAPSPPYIPSVRPPQGQLVFAAQPTGHVTSSAPHLASSPEEGPHTWTTHSAHLSAPTPSPLLHKRQVVVEIEVITVVNVIPKVNYPNASPVAVTVTVPPPANTMISSGGWPIINPGSSAACWSDMACNSVCPNFQQNGWYAHCVDSACTQCRCQIISSNMCTGQAWTNASWVSNAPARTIQINPAVATVTVVVAQAAPSVLDRMDRRTQWMGLFMMSLCLSAWLVS
ncbi:hypothetical protein PCASD_08043 [Puccinia coronata f. sp. avenae]|uniref:Uncharacterized protein n=1 Tax=Puccinia coronata f. sp. avenae TaxID=200324 RepID=A0A2N5UZI1_9BASI|nr:hypothetical protein PCASD_08043 [Puccinia coronata f. sp. avenae]